MRKTVFVDREFYHLYNRGVDKRDIFLDKWDFERFFTSIEEFNAIDPIGSIYENSFSKEKHRAKKLVDFIAYCVNPNHYHFILRQLVEKGIEKFMHRFGTGYTKYFNNKYKRDGVLFQGKFKAVRIDTNEYLLHLSSYVNLNDRVHKLGSRFSKSSWREYLNGGEGLCKKNLILKQFKETLEYKEFAESSLKDILERRKLHKEMENLLLEAN